MGSRMTYDAGGHTYHSYPSSGGIDRTGLDTLYHVDCLVSPSPNKSMRADSLLDSRKQ